VTEVGHTEGEVVLLQDIFVFDFRMGTEVAGRSVGLLKATGLRPQFTERLADRGVKVDTAIFEPGAEARVPAISRHSMPGASGWPR
jgi:pilus assembly protein CpaF